MSQTKVCVNIKNGSFCIRREDRDAARYWTGPHDNRFIEEYENGSIIWSTNNLHLAKHLRRKL